ncbi:uncharacterized protein EDB93DRAFT_1103132 [Suillus bovinus]|uniref:uncharacterized protein n=1 Tax=Suillus bovinus TaxID=48563 RepID=UPI001B87D6F2|nr:uncharacterized protein EDB93DRAFT_1103132 [Suillus bovinus]KAG2151166.1 hypothetical protein EDB93DRAFT_1103132 [Suillus bovinus]
MYTTDFGAQQVLVHLYTLFMAISILIYDHMATLPEEIVFIWRCPKTMSAVLFLANRYFAVLVNIFDLASNFLTVSTKVLHSYLAVWISRWLYKCYVFPNNSLFAEGWRYLSDMSQTVWSTATAFQHTQQRRYGMAWVATFIYELLIFVLTVFRTWKIRGLSRFSLISRGDILDVIFHDGVMYFAGMVLVNLPNILTYFSRSDHDLVWSSEHIPETSIGSLGPFTSCLSVTLISRMMLNLHGCIDTGILSTPTETSSDVLTTRVDVESAVCSDHW